jgi:phospholipid/cholesterol/gamma-HCH transport system ATP-binding protein
VEETVLKIEDVSVSFDHEKVLDSISMRIPQGRLVTITGPSGCGKSTLLKIAAGLIPPDRGTVYIGGIDIFNASRGSLYEMRKEYSFVFQDAALISNLTVFNNIALPLRYHFNLDEEEVETKVYNILENFDLREIAGQLPAHLSMGQRKLVGFARALVVNPKLIFFDEPVTGTDAIHRQKMIDKLIPLRDDPDITLIMVSHNLEFIKAYADHIALLYAGKLFAYGRRDEILRSSDPILQKIMSIIVDEEAVIAEEVLGLLTGNE